MSNITAETMVRIAQLGMPPRLEHGPEHDAVFDPFLCDGVEYFRYYDASISCWMIGKTILLEDRVYWKVPVEPSQDDRPEDFLAANALSFLPAPHLPDLLEGDMIRGPFWHGKRRFFWLLNDLALGWTLCLAVSPESNTHADILRLFYREDARPLAFA